jgi:hypothetical protein
LFRGENIDFILLGRNKSTNFRPTWKAKKIKIEKKLQRKDELVDCQ